MLHPSCIVLLMTFNPDLMTSEERAKALALIADIQRQSAEILEMLAEMRTLRETPIVTDDEK
jgi:uncharacterized membrane protein YgaE (UPF0421/DUF939 family)